MGAPDPGLEAALQPVAETLLTAFRTIKPAERAKHAGVLDYWMSIRGEKEFPPLHDLDPLEISDAGPCSILLELISGGQDAEVRHLGEALQDEVTVERIIDAPNPSILSCIAKKLPIVAISRDFLAFEDNYDKGGGMTRCWVTLLPLSSCGSWVDYVYAYVTVETLGGKAAKAAEPASPAEEVAADEAEAVAENPDETIESEAARAAETPVDEAFAEEAEFAEETRAVEPEAVADVVPFTPEEPTTAVEEIFELEEATEPEEVVDLVEPVEQDVAVEEQEAASDEPQSGIGPGFSRLLDGIANLTGFYGQGVQTDSVVPVMELADAEPPIEEPAVVEPEAVALEADAEEPAVVEPEAVALEADVEETVVEPLAVEPVDELPPVELPVEPVGQPVAEETAPEPTQQPASALEGTLQNHLSEVRAKADEARQAQLRATQALHEGLSAAYDFALDAETSPEEYLRLVEAQGLKIQLRAPMAPVAKLAFEGVCDAGTIKQFETVLAWALKEELPRGSLLERIEQAGGISELLSGV